MRDKTDDIVEKINFGKLGMKEHTLVGQILSPAETTRYRALAATANFLAIDSVNTTPQMTRFRGRKVCSKWLQERIDDHNIQSDYKCTIGLKV